VIAWATIGSGSVLVLAVVLAQLMVGYVLWTADQLTAQLTAQSAAESTAQSTGQSTAPRSPAMRGAADQAGQLAACTKIAMGVTMGYMQLVML
jgi:hypothetical protein